MNGFSFSFCFYFYGTNRKLLRCTLTTLCNLLSAVYLPVDGLFAINLQVIIHSAHLFTLFFLASILFYFLF